MRDEDKTKAQLIQELQQLRRQVAQLQPHEPHLATVAHGSEQVQANLWDHEQFVQNVLTAR
jgi:hypothetical protein